MKVKAGTRIEIEALVRDKVAKGEVFTPEELAFVRNYEGAGGQGSKGATG
ncbi:MAG: hypothetical protein ACOYOO_05820 [Saprospiraceae bacterium]